MSDQADNARPPLPTTLEEMRDYLSREHDVVVGPDDPVLLLHSMHRVFLESYEHLLERHNEALSQVIGAALKGLTEEALSENLQAQVRLAERTNLQFETQYKRAKFLNVASLASAFVCLPVLIYVLLK